MHSSSLRVHFCKSQIVGFILNNIKKSDFSVHFYNINVNEFRKKIVDQAAEIQYLKQYLHDSNSKLNLFFTKSVIFQDF